MKSKNTPPKIAEWLIKNLSHSYHQRTALGDLEEIYYEMAEDEGVRPARQWYRKQAVNSIKYLLNSIFFWSTSMLKNYLKITLRNINRYKGYSFLNIAGLVIGITSVIIIFLYIQYEFSYETFHENADNIYRIVAKEPSNVFMGNNVYSVTQGILAPTLIEEYTEVVSATRFGGAGGLLGYENKWFIESGVYADENCLDIFTFPMISGDENSALNEPFSIVLTESLSKKLFGELDPLDKVVNFNKQTDLKVTGVIGDLPENTHVRFSFLISFATLLTDQRGAERINDWRGSSYRTYVQLSRNYPYKEFENKLVSFVDKYVGDRGMSEEGEKYKYILQPIKSIHLHSHVNFEFPENSDIKYIYLYSVIGFFILLIACTNYVNLATARSLKRVREIGIRKVVGAQRKQLFVQFIMEAVVFSVFAMTVSLILVYFSLPFINSIAGRNTVMDLSGNLMLVMALAVIILFIGLVSGAYPAVYVSAFRTVYALKSTGQNLSKNSILRNTLVVGQFFISIVLMVCTIVVLSQLNYINSKSLGYDISNVIRVRLDYRDYNRIYPALREELLKHPDILNLSSGSGSPMQVDSKTMFNVEENNGGMKGIHCYNLYINYDYINLFKIGLAGGRNYSTEFQSDRSGAVMVNESLVRDFGWNDPIGKRITVTAYGELKEDWRVIGVVKDFHNRSMHLNVTPLILRFSDESYAYIFIRIRPENVPETIEYIENRYAEINSGYPFRFNFLPEDYDSMYASEHKLGKIFVLFSGLTILIACLGLFGLISFVAESRTKEIGIRKVLGANIPGTVLMLIKDFIKLILIANAIAWPIAWISMDNWLKQYAYKIDLGISVFVTAGILSLFIALITIGFQSVKASISNPVDSLRYE
ncbi:ABC transporter permease [candidate division KSB1 bacterium]